MTLEEKIARLMKGTAALYAPSPEILERLMDALVKQRYDIGQIVGFHDGRYEYKCYTKVTVRNCEYEVFDSNCTKVEWGK